MDGVVSRNFRECGMVFTPSFTRENSRAFPFKQLLGSGGATYLSYVINFCDGMSLGCS